MNDWTPLIVLYLLARAESLRANVLAPAGEWLGNKAYDLTHPGQLPRARHRGMTAADGVYHYAQLAGFSDPDFATAIAMAESGGNPRAVAKTDREHSVGLWQINLRAHPQYTEAQMLDPKQNAAAAYKISRGGTNWRPWSTYQSGAYQRYL
jgi:hypothetical protein